jgi:hypothetical protein
MVGMDHNGYWYGYLAARHDVFFYIGVVSIAAVLISALTGKTLVRFHGVVSKTEDPKGFWQAVIILFIMGAACIGLYTFGPS